MVNEITEKYGGLFLYEVSYNTERRYVVANPDQVRELLKHRDFYNEEGVMGNADEIKIKKMGKVAIEQLTLDRLINEEIRVKQKLGKV